jgi:hypothetical protein
LQEFEESEQIALKRCLASSVVKPTARQVASPGIGDDGASRIAIADPSTGAPELHHSITPSLRAPKFEDEHEDDFDAPRGYSPGKIESRGGCPNDARSFVVSIEVKRTTRPNE